MKGNFLKNGAANFDRNFFKIPKKSGNGENNFGKTGILKCKVGARLQRKEYKPSIPRDGKTSNVFSSFIQSVPNWYLHFQMIITRDQKIVQGRIIHQKKSEKYANLCDINFI